jgi:pilus assembly protein Flp/PilA
MVQVFTITENISEYVGILVKEFFLSEEGATAIEYALMAALIGATIIGAQTAMGQSVFTMYQGAANTIVAAMGS